jgi:hypothetical protein
LLPSAYLGLGPLGRISKPWKNPRVELGAVLQALHLLDIMISQYSIGQYRDIKISCPLKEESLPVLVRLPPDQVVEIDVWRRWQDDLPTRPEAIRRLIELGLKAKGR